MSVNLNWATIIAVVSGLAGVAGSIITPIWGQNLSNEVQAILQALSGILVILAGAHATSVVSTTAKYKAAARFSGPPS